MANRGERFLEEKMASRGLSMPGMAEKAFNQGYRSFTSPEEQEFIFNPLLHRRLKGLQWQIHLNRKLIVPLLVKLAKKI